MIDDKFIVFHRADRRWQPTDDLGRTGFDYYDPGLAIDDAVVIRKKDTFAAPALFGYACSIAIAIDILEKTGHHSKTVETLRGIADYFNAQAEDCIHYDSRLPD